MIDLYRHGMSVCAAKVRFALGEKQIAWESRYVDIHKGDQFAPDYVKLNPKAVVPTLVHDGHVPCSASDCELTDTYTPAAIDIAPATSPATPAIKTSSASRLLRQRQRSSLRSKGCHRWPRALLLSAIQCG